MRLFSHLPARALSRALSQALLGALCLVSLTGCGWKLRGDANIPFESIYIGFANSSLLGNELKRTVRSSGKIRVVDAAKDAEVLLTPIAEPRDKLALSTNSAGQIREYQLRLGLTFRVHDAKGTVYLPDTTISLTRDVSFNETQILAKEYEEALLYRDMQTDMVQQVLRRLAAIDRSKPVGG